MNEDIQYTFTISAGSNGAEISCDLYPSGSWLVGQDADKWFVQPPNKDAHGLWDNPVEAIAYCVEQILKAMDSGSCYG